MFQNSLLIVQFLQYLEKDNDDKNRACGSELRFIGEFKRKKIVYNSLYFSGY